MLTGPDGIDIHYEEFGTGPTLLFINAALATGGSWEQQVGPLGVDHRTVTFDWPGTGKSARPNIRYTTELILETTLALIDHLDAEDLTVVAQGLGGHIGILAAEARPDRVHRLVLASTGPWFRGTRDGRVGGLSVEFEQWMVAARTTDVAVAAFTDYVNRFLFLHPARPEVVDWIVRDALEWPPYVFREYNDAMADLDHRERAARIEQPVLVLHGRHDLKQRYEGAEVLAEIFPNARLRTFENSAHVPGLEEKLRFNEALRAFVRER